MITSNNEQVEYPHINKSTLLLFCSYVFVWYIQLGYRVSFLGSIRFEFIYAIILIILAIFTTPKINWNCPLLINIILFLLVIVIQIPFSYDFDTSWDTFIDRIIKFAFMFFFIAAFVRSPRHMKYFLAAFLLACMKMGQEGFVGKITGGLIWENQGIMRLHGSTPMYMHPNSFSGMALGTLPFVYYLWPLTNKYIRIILSVIGLLSFNIIIYSGSRTGYVGLAVFLFCLYVTTKNKNRFIMIMAILAVISLPLIPSDYIGRFDSIFTEKDKEGESIEARKQILKDSWHIFLEHPFGVGVAAFPKVRTEEFGRSQDTHNLYFEIATNLGFQGLIIVSLLLYKILATLQQIKSNARKYIIKLHDIGGQNNDKLISDLVFIESISLATTCFVIIRLALGLFGMDLYEIYWWFAIGITFSLYSMMSIIDSFISNNNPITT